MEKRVVEKCIKCQKEVKEAGVRSMGTGEAATLCARCLKALYPEGREMPVEMDKDGNLYFIDKPGNRMVIFFAYGDVPYSSCTEVSLEEEECGNGFGLC